MYSRNRVLIISSAVVVIALIGGLYYLNSISSSETAHVSLTLPGSNPSFNFLWAYAGVEVGIFEREGIDLEIIQSSPPSVAVQAVIAGSADFTAVAESAATAMLQGADLRILAHPVVDTPLYLVSKAEIDSMEALRGGTIGVNRLASRSTVVLKEILMKFDLVPGEDVEVAAYGDISTRLGAILGGILDASVVNPMESVIAEDEGLNILVDSRDVLDRRSIVFVAASQQMIDERPEIVRKMVKATILSVEYIVAHPEETISLAMELMDIDEDLARETHQQHKDGWDYRPDPDDVQYLFDVQNSFLEEPVDFEVSDWIDYSFVNEVLEELGEEPLQMP